MPQPAGSFSGGRFLNGRLPAVVMGQRADACWLPSPESKSIPVATSTAVLDAYVKGEAGFTILEEDSIVFFDTNPEGLPLKKCNIVQHDRRDLRRDMVRCSLMPARTTSYAAHFSRSCCRPLCLSVVSLHLGRVPVNLAQGASRG